MEVKQVTYGEFAYLRNTLVYVSRVIDGMAYVCQADYPYWHKKVPVGKLKPCK